MRQFVAALLLVAGVSATARADEPTLVASGVQVRSSGPLTVDGGLFFGLPSALGTGLSSGVEAGVARGRVFVWEAQASWSSATESSITWTVTQSDLRLRVGAGVQHAIGRGRVGLALRLGPTVVHETRDRNQGARAGLTGSDLETSTYSLLPAGDLVATVSIHVAGPWLFTTGGGPALVILDGSAHAGWTTQIGVAWQP
jgi:hypothetical protein